MSTEKIESVEDHDLPRPLKIHVLTMKDLRFELKKDKVISVYDFLNADEYNKADFVFFIDQNEEVHIMKAKSSESIINGETVKEYFIRTRHGINS